MAWATGAWPPLVDELHARSPPFSAHTSRPPQAEHISAVRLRTYLPPKVSVAPPQLDDAIDARSPSMHGRRRRSPSCHLIFLFSSSVVGLGEEAGGGPWTAQVLPMRGTGWRLCSLLAPCLSASSSTAHICRRRSPPQLDDAVDARLPSMHGPAAPSQELLHLDGLL